MTPIQRQQRFSALLLQFREILASAQKERPSRDGYKEVTIRGRTYQEPSWAVFEVETMLRAVNEVRVADGKPEATTDDLWRIEGYARGHSDYSLKFALYCAELAIYGKVACP